MGNGDTMKVIITGMRAGYGEAEKDAELWGINHAIPECIKGCFLERQAAGFTGGGEADHSSLPIVSLSTPHCSAIALAMQGQNLARSFALFP